MKKRDVYIGVILACLFLFVYTFYYCMVFELNYAYNADAPLYWAVGRGILNGLTPYSGMYENKPLGIFLLSAINFLITDDTIVCNIFTLIALISIAFMPVLIVYELLKKQKFTLNKRNFICLVLSFLYGILMMMYSESRSGAFQVEAIGAACSLYYIWSVVFLKNANTKKQRILGTILSAIFIQLVVLFKEPFLLISLISGLLFIDNIKDFLKCILIPCLIGGFCYIVILLVTNMIGPYYNLYILHMFDMKLSGHASPFYKFKYFNLLFIDLAKFDIFLPSIVLLTITMSIIEIIYCKNNLSVIYHVLRFLLAILIAFFCVSLGGQFFNHHFIFAVPIYLSLAIAGFITLYKLLFHNDIIYKFSIVFICFLAFVIVRTGENSYGGSYKAGYMINKERAEYVDRLLDFYGEDRYQFIGFNGISVFYGLTKHSPQGPVFAQDKDNFTSKDNWFSQEFIEQLNKSNIVILKEITALKLVNDIDTILKRDFTTVPPKEFEKNPFDYIIYYRKGKFSDE